MKITDIFPQKKDPKRFNIFLDNKFAFAVSLEVKVANKLKVDKELSEKEIAEIIFQDQVDRLFDKALKFLAFRPRSEKEIRGNLLQKLRFTDKGEEETKNFEKSIETVVERLKKMGQINDKDFAVWWFEQRTRFKKTSPRLIKSELFAKGVDKEIINEVVSESDIDATQLAIEAGRKKQKGFKKFEDRVFKEKMSRYLASKGFEWEAINKAVDTLIKEE